MPTRPHTDKNGQNKLNSLRKSGCKDFGNALRNVTNEVDDAENGKKEEVEGEEDGKAVSQSRYPMLSFPLSC